MARQYQFDCDCHVSLAPPALSAWLQELPLVHLIQSTLQFHVSLLRRSRFQRLSLARLQFIASKISSTIAASTALSLTEELL